MEDIGIIILNHNTSELTIQCVNSIREHTPAGINYSIVIVDNNSGIPEFEKLGSITGLKDIVIFRNRMNSGFASGHMAGINLCSPKYYYFLNNDTLFLNDNLSVLFRFMEENLSAGICSGQMYDSDKSPGINFNYFPDLKLKLLGSGILRVFKKEDYPVKGKVYHVPVKVPVINGSSMFIRASAFEMTGGFDTTFFLYCEEEDIAMRMKKSGYDCYLVPEAGYIHLGGQSTPGDRRINYPYLREFYISQHYLYLKHYGKIPAMIWRVTQFLRAIRKFYIDFHYVRLALFILAGPSFKSSLRHAEKIATQVRI